MITLHRDTLSFTFPEIAREVRSLVERKIQQIAAKLPPTWDRAELLSQIESHRDFHKLDRARQEAARSKIQTWMPADIEACLREFAFNWSGLGTDLFTSLSIKFERTMRLPDNDYTYALPTGLGQLPLRSVDDFPETAQPLWITRGGVVTPLRRSESLWLWFSSRYRFAVKIKVGEMNALSNAPWSPDLQRAPQNYLVAPAAPWEEDDEVVRWLVAMPSQVPNTKAASAENESAIQLEITPMRAESVYRDEHAFLLPPTIHEFFMKLIFAAKICKKLDEIKRPHEREDIEETFEKSTEPVLATARQKIPDDSYQLKEWDQAQTVRCFVHVCDPLAWRRMTGAIFPHAPLTEKEYLNARIPWFDNYEDHSEMFQENLRSTSDRIAQPMHTHPHSDIRGCLGSP